MTLLTNLDQGDYFSRGARAIEHLLPGVTLVAIVTSAAYGLRQLPMLETMSPMILAIFLGMLFANLTTVPAPAHPGIAVMGKKLLRLAVALLGLQLTLGQVYQVGFTGMILLVAIVAGTYAFTLFAARLLGVDLGLARLLAAGTSICGASAIAAASAVEKDEDKDVSYAVACVTLFGTAAMLIYPVFARSVGMTPLDYGFWTGASVHEVAQVVAAGFQNGAESGEYSVVVKLSRVLLLAPLLIAMTMMMARRNTAQGTRISPQKALPLFVIGFVVIMLLNSFDLVPAAFKQLLVPATPVMLTAALGALGLGTRFDALLARGAGPLILAGTAWLFISSASLLATMLL